MITRDIGKRRQMNLLVAIEKNAPAHRYHQAFNNAMYSSVIVDQTVEYANMVTDCALLVCGETFYNDQEHRTFVFNGSDDLLAYLELFA